MRGGVGLAGLIVLVVGCQWIGDIGTRELANGQPDASVGGAAGAGGVTTGGSAGASGSVGIAGSDGSTGGTTGFVFGKQFGDHEDQTLSGMDLLPDPSDLVIAGAFHGELDFGATTTALQADADGDLWVARLDLTGKPKYSRRIELDDSIGAFQAAVAFGDQGQVYVGGSTRGATSIGSFSATGDPDGDVFVAALDFVGEPTALWTYPAPLGQSVNHLTAGGGEVVMSGRFDDQLDFGGSTSVLLAPNGPEAFIAKVDATTGEGIWARKFDKCPELSLNGVARAVDGSVYVAADYQGICSIDTIDFADEGSPPDCLVMRLNTTGTVDHLLAFRGHCNANNVVVSSTGEVFVVGAVEGKSLIFTDIDAFDRDAFVVKTDAALGPAWGRSLPHIGLDTATGIDIGAVGDPFITGMFADGTVVVRLAANSGLPVGGFAFSSEPSFAKPGPVVRLNQINELFLAGNFDHPVNFGGGSISPVGSGAGTSDLFFGKYQQP